MSTHDQTSELGAALERATRPVELRLYPRREPGELEERFAELARRCATLAPRIGWRLRSATDEPAGTPLVARPALTLGASGDERVRYLALPEGPEWPPFVWALAELARAVATTATPADSSLRVLIAASCPHCPRAVRAALEVGLVEAPSVVHIVDVARYPDLATRLGVRTVPTTLLDDELTVTDTLEPAQLCALVRSQQMAGAADRVFDSLVASGRLEAASRVLASAQGAAQLCRAWAASTTSSRIPLLLAVEGALERAPRCLDSAVAGLGALLAAPDVPLVGDTADLLGRLGHESARPLLGALCAHGNAEVAEAAADALEALDARERAR